MAKKRSSTRSKRIAANPFLKQVIVRLDFGAVLDLSSKSTPVKYIPKEIRTAFRETSVEHKRQRNLVVNVNDNQTIDTIQEFDEWSYATEGGKNKIVFTNHYLTFEYQSYTSFQELLSVVQPVVERLYSAHPDLVVARLGMRYMNQITRDEPRPFDWRRYINPHLLGSFRFVEDPKTISRSFHTIEYRFSDESQMRFWYGMPNPDFPAVISGKMFVLDFDAYVANVNQSDSLFSFLNAFHERIRTQFFSCILEPLREQIHVDR